MLEHRTAVDAETGDAGDGEFDCQHVALLAGWVVTGCTEDGTHRTVGKGSCVEAGGRRGVLVVPQANRVLGHSLSSRHWFPVTSDGNPHSSPLGHGCGLAAPCSRYRALQ